ncbi:hypothetical protein BDZ89DRAFT_262552 [Hymenopellis radicata]|nr:hypothetical protein BDZ89DRAFT_262552 [Hymenopellis radicata]
MLNFEMERRYTVVRSEACSSMSSFSSTNSVRSTIPCSHDSLWGIGRFLVVRDSFILCQRSKPTLLESQTQRGKVIFLESVTQVFSMSIGLARPKSLLLPNLVSIHFCSILFSPWPSPPRVSPSLYLASSLVYPASWHPPVRAIEYIYPA